MKSFGQAANREKPSTGIDTLAQVRDVGECLKHLLDRYDRLVMRLAGGRSPAPELLGRIDWLNLQLAAAADEMQELIVLEREESRATGSGRAAARPRAAPRPFVVRLVAEGRA